MYRFTNPTKCECNKRQVKTKEMILIQKLISTVNRINSRTGQEWSLKKGYCIDLCRSNDIPYLWIIRISIQLQRGIQRTLSHEKYMIIAFQIMCVCGTKPQNRLSWLLSRLSPIIK